MGMVDNLPVMLFADISLGARDQRNVSTNVYPNPFTRSDILPRRPERTVCIGIYNIICCVGGHDSTIDRTKHADRQHPRSASMIYTYIQANKPAACPFTHPSNQAMCSSSGLPGNWFPAFYAHGLCISDSSAVVPETPQGNIFCVCERLLCVSDKVTHSNSLQIYGILNI